MLLETDHKPVKHIPVNKELIFEVFSSSIFPPELVDTFSVALTKKNKNLTSFTLTMNTTHIKSHSIANTSSSLIY